MDFLKKTVQIRSCIAVLLLWTSQLPFSLCIEEYEREIFLAPRNFNPHPYEHHLAKIQDPGPVLFPTENAEEESGDNNRYNIITVDSARTKHPVDNHPYSKVAEKIKYLINSKYGSTRENQIDNQILDALTQQGAKVLTYAPQELKNYDGNPQPRKKNYSFGYKVKDKATGDDFSHHQVRSAKATNGEYRVKLPDGRLQIVSYKADKNGYKADVKYEVDSEATQQQLIHRPVISTRQGYVPQNVDITKVPVRQFVPNAGNSYDYLGEEDKQGPLRDQNIVFFEPAGPINYVDIAAQPNPTSAYVISEQVDHQLQGYHYPNVQIYTTNPREHFHGNYVPATAPTPVKENKVIRYTSTPVPPTVQAHVANNGDNGLYKISVASTYAPPAHGPHGHKNVINTVAPSSRPNDVYRHTLEQENELPEGIYIVGKGGKR